MCGITGKISFSKKEVSEREITAMNQTVRHRGPDDEGVYISPDKKVGLGHQRLAIIDLSILGHQPMSYLNRYWIVFNGEIYNYQEKRARLALDGYKFKSKSDTEVVLVLYHKFGINCLKHLRGMFAFAIYDEKNNTLFCARDRIGKKPFKYYLDDQVFIFASELKAILTQKEYKREPDWLAIHHYLTLQYCPSPLTGFEGIKKLEPAHFLFLDLKTKRLIKKRYWRLDYSKKLDLSEEQWKKKIMDKLEESTSLRMISDVPIGAFLSGGIDSSAVVGLMSKLSTNKVKTFTIAFNEKKYDESKYAQIIADKFKTNHTVFTVKPETIEVLPMLVKQYEEPYADSSALATYYVSKLSRKYVTVALNGDGGDENFAGYPWYGIQKFALGYQKLSGVNDLLVVPLCKKILNALPHTFFERSYRFAKSLSQDYRKRYLNYLCYFTNQMKKTICQDWFIKKIWHKDTFDLIAGKFNEAKTTDKLDQALYVDINTYLPDDLLVKVDIASMTASLEGRSPFLDQEMLELTAKIPFNLKLKGLNNKKYILRKALEGFIPDEILNRRKMGFMIPKDKWFTGNLHGYVSSVLTNKDSFISKFLRTEKINELIIKNKNTKIDYSRHLWALLTLELWFKEFFN